ncbi:MAG TPA: CoA ester lyase [Micromonosporaceae bacterium]|nr:CoA ester lyase [Micromonosporaceae bacterium]
MATARPHRPARSYLYVPGDRPDRLSKAMDRGADALIVDLEDSVPVAAKAAARATTADWLSRQVDRRCQVWVRVNPDSLAEDVGAVIGNTVDGIVLPKADPALVRDADRLLGDLERAQGIASAVAVICLVETSQGLLRAAELAASPRVHRLGIGEADLLAELRIRPSEGRRELASLRLQVVVASAAAGIAAPMAPTSTDFRDLDALRESTRELMALGFRARTAIHPAQVRIINDVFTPSEDDVERARRIVAAFEAAVQRGSGVCVDDDGRMIDAAVVRSAREVLDLAGENSAR